MSGGSHQLRTYVAARRAGRSTDEACELSGIEFGEARLWDADEAKGELGWVGQPIAAGGPAATDLPPSQETGNMKKIDTIVDAACAAFNEAHPDGSASARPVRETEDGPLGDVIAVDTIDLASDTLAGDIRDTLLSIFKHRPKPWQQLTENEQRDVANSLDGVARNLVSRACLLLAAGGRLTASATLENFQQKGREVVAKLDLSAMPETVAALSNACGNGVQLVFVDPAPFKGERAAVAIDADQPDLIGENDENAEFEKAA